MAASSGLAWILRPLSLLNILISLYKPVRGISLGRLILLEAWRPESSSHPLLLDVRIPYVFSAFNRRERALCR